jgi:quercetin dioxygenase-like cupin family protein
MDVRSVLDARKFLPDKPGKANLFSSERMFCDVHALAPGQEQKPHVHEASDKVCYVIEGCGTFSVGGEVREVGERNAVYCPAGVEHGVRNDSPSNLTLLVLMMPHPDFLPKKA